MSWLVDTDVLSALAPNRQAPPAAVTAWLEERSEALHLSVVTLAELSQGAALLAARGATARARALETWIAAVHELYAHRILAFDSDAALVTGRLLAHARAGGHAPSFEDAAIAGTAGWNGFTVLTRNLKHFVPMGVAAADPFAAF